MIIACGMIHLYISFAWPKFMIYLCGYAFTRQTKLMLFKLQITQVSHEKNSLANAALHLFM